MEPNEVVWQGRVGDTPLTVGVSHAERIVAEWDTPNGPRHKVASSVAEFERTVLFQLLLSAGETDATSTEEVTAAVEKAQAERPAPVRQAEKRRKSPKPRRRRPSRSRRR